MKLCGRCKQELPAGDFFRNRSNRDGLADYCRPCSRAYRIEWQAREPGRTKAYWRAHHARHPMAAREKSRKAKYGITPAEYAQLLEAFEYKCAVCDSGRDLHIDHDHRTGVIRGILCGHCNRGLGMFRDDPDLMARAIAYLSRPMVQPKPA